MRAPSVNSLSLKSLRFGVLGSALLVGTGLVLLIMPLLALLELDNGLVKEEITWWGLALLWAIAFLLIYLGRQLVLTKIDNAKCELTIVQFVWVVRKASRVIPLDHVTSVEVRVDDDHYAWISVITATEEVPLVGGSSRNAYIRFAERLAAAVGCELTAVVDSSK